MTCNEAAQPLPPHLLEGVDGAIGHLRAAIETLETGLDIHWRALGILAEIKESGRMSLAQRAHVAEWLAK